MVALVVLVLALLMALGNYMNLRQEEAMSQADDPVRKSELKKEEGNRQSMYVLLGVAGLSIVLGVATAMRRRTQHGEGYAAPGVSVTVKDGYLLVTGKFKRLELWHLNGQIACSTTQQNLNLTNIRHGRFILNVRTDDGEFSRKLCIENFNETGGRPECWSKSRIEWIG